MGVHSSLHLWLDFVQFMVFKKWRRKKKKKAGEEEREKRRGEKKRRVELGGEFKKEYNFYITY